MEAAEIKKLDLSSKDFDLIIKGLDALPNAGAGISFMKGIMKTIMLGDNPEALAELERKEAIEERQAERERQVLIEDVKLLQGKLIRLKRILIENNLFEQIADITKPGGGAITHYFKGVGRLANAYFN